MLLRQENNVSQQAAIKGHPSPFLATQLPGCVFWGRDNIGTDALGRVTTWFDKTPLGNNALGPALDTRKPTRLDNAYSIFPAVNCAGGATLQHLTLDTIAAMFNGNDAAITVVSVMQLNSVAATQVMYGLTNTALVNPRHDFFIGGGPIYSGFRRDDAAVGILNSTAPGVPVVGRHIIIDIFRQVPAGTGVRTFRLDGAATTVTDAACNVGVITFNAFTIAAFRNGSVNPTVPTNEALFEMAIYTRALQLGEAQQYEAYALERYDI